MVIDLLSAPDVFSVGRLRLSWNGLLRLVGCWLVVKRSVESMLQLRTAVSASVLAKTGSEGAMWNCYFSAYLL